MMFSNLVHLKSLLMVVTAAAGTLAGGAVITSYGNTRDPGTFLVSLNPTSLSIIQSSSSTSTVTVTSINGFTGIVTLSLNLQGATLSASLNPTSLSVPANGHASSKVTVTAENTLGSYTIIVTALESSHGKTITASTSLAVQAVSSQDFTITASPSNITNIRGLTNTTTITIASINGYTGNVSLTATTPFGYITATGGQNPLTLTSSGTSASTLLIATSPNTALGTYSITVTGTGTSRTHTTTINLNVIDPVPPPVVVENLTLTSSQFINNTSLVLTLQNSGNTSLTLTSYTIRDSSGDAWSLANYQGPTIAPKTSATATMYIANNCPGCTYTGILGLFQQFMPGHTYTVTVTTATGSSFPFTVTR